MKILHLTLKKKWFDMIAAGIKREEYREIKAYWHKRLYLREYDAVRFRNGYSNDSPVMTVEFRGVRIGTGNVKWGAPELQSVYIIALGNVLEVRR